MNGDAFVDFLLNAIYSPEIEECVEENVAIIKHLYSKEILEKLAQSSPQALKFLFIFCFKLEQETILSLREENNIYYDIINMLEINNHTS